MKTIQEKIDEETANIKKLEETYPPCDFSKSDYDEVNKPYLLHHIEVRDAYWRRRMLIAERDGLDKDEISRIY
jgi:hypothetical protein